MWHQNKPSFSPQSICFLSFAALWCFVGFISCLKVSPSRHWHRGLWFLFHPCMWKGGLVWSCASFTGLIGKPLNLDYEMQTGSPLRVAFISRHVGTHLLSVTHLGSLVCGDSKPWILLLFSFRSLLGKGGAFAGLWNEK